MHEKVIHRSRPPSPLSPPLPLFQREPTTLRAILRSESSRAGRNRITIRITIQRIFVWVVILTWSLLQRQIPLPSPRRVRRASTLYRFDCCRVIVKMEGQILMEKILKPPWGAAAEGGGGEALAAKVPACGFGAPSCVVSLVCSFHLLKMHQDFWRKKFVNWITNTLGRMLYLLQVPTPLRREQVHFVGFFFLPRPPPCV